METKPTTVKRKQQEPEDVSDPEVQSDDEVEHIDDQVEHSASEILTKEVALCHHCESSFCLPLWL